MLDELVTYFKNRLTEAQDLRVDPPNINPNTNEPEWVAYEIMAMYEAVNTVRFALCMPTLPRADIEEVERLARGDNYETKFAIGCAELIAYK